MPDFDIDFCRDNRWRVIEYVRGGLRQGMRVADRHLRHHVVEGGSSHDVRRVLDMPYNFCDSLSADPVEQNKPLSLAKAIDAEPQLKEKIEAEEEVRGAFRASASKLEDLTRNVGMPPAACSSRRASLLTSARCIRPTAAAQWCRSTTRTTPKRSVW